MTHPGTARGLSRVAGLPRQDARGGLARFAAACLALAFAAVGAAAPASPARAAAPPGARSPGGSVIGGPQLAGHGVIVNYPAHARLPLPSAPASAWVVADAGAGQVLAAKDPHGWYRPASTLKVLTADALMPVLNPDQVVLATPWAASIEPSKVGLIAGQGYRVKDLFKALLLISANDAAVSLAEAVGSYHKGLAMINAEARRLRADDTVAKTANGLDAPGQHASAYDEALFARQALRIPQFTADEALLRTRFPLTARHWITLYNQNTMLRTFPGDLGGKIGWTTPAKATFIGWARRHGRTLVVTILHCTPLAEMTAAAKLLDWGFAMDGKVRPVGTLVSPLRTPTRHALGRHAPLAKAAHTRAAASASPAGPIAAGAGALALAALAGTAITLVARRGRRARTRSAR